MSVSELDGWEPRRTGHRRRHGVAVGSGVIGLGLVGIVWALVAIHDGGPVAWEDTGHTTACAPDPLDAPGDLTVVLPVGTLRPYRLLEARLIGAHGLSLVDADIAVVTPGADGSYVLPPVSAGWPTLEGGTVRPDSLIPAAGAELSGLPQALVLHLHVDDPTAESAFEDVGLVYRAGLTRYQQRLEYTQRLVPGDQVCTTS